MWMLCTGKLCTNSYVFPRYCSLFNDVCTQYSRTYTVLSKQSAANFRKALSNSLEITIANGFLFSKFRLFTLLVLLKEVTILHHQRFWAQDKLRSRWVAQLRNTIILSPFSNNCFSSLFWASLSFSCRCLGRHDLIIWPDSFTSFPSIRSSSVLSSLVFTGYTSRVSSHVTHNVQAILDDDDRNPVRSKGKEALRATRNRRISSSRAVSPTSPSKRKDARQRSQHPHHSVISPTGKLPPSPLKHSPTGAFSPTKHYGHSFFPAQLSPSKHHHSVPLSPSWTQQNPHGSHPGDLPIGEHHPSSGHVLPTHPIQGSPAIHSPPGHGGTPQRSPMGHVLPPLQSPPGKMAPPTSVSSVQHLHPFSPTR